MLLEFEICGSSEITQNTLNRPPGYLRRCQHSTSESTRSVHDVVRPNLREIHDRAGDGLVPLGLCFIEQRVSRLFRRKVGTVAWSTTGVVVRHAKPIQDRLGVVLLADRQRTVPTVSRSLHLQHKR